jgi:hypothetical protein
VWHGLLVDRVHCSVENTVNKLVLDNVVQSGCA